MCRELVHIYGPISICGYGFMIFIGVILFAYLVNRDPARSRLMTSDQFVDVLVFGTFTGLIGGRILFILTNLDIFTHWSDLLALWDGGLSILGAILGILFILPWYLIYRKIAVIPFLDLVAIYAPLLEAVARIGCFCAGCCYGVATTMPWGVTYHDVRADAPVNLCVHPTQLYSAAILFIMFIFMRYIARRYLTKPGQLFLTFLLMASAERFVVDFWRADREFFSCDYSHYLSLHQYIAFALAVFSIVWLIIISHKSWQKQYEPL